VKLVSYISLLRSTTGAAFGASWTRQQLTLRLMTRESAPSAVITSFREGTVHEYYRITMPLL
jgi:hypothetical protein